MDLSLNYELLKSLHIIFFTTWMAGLFYLPRLFVYHSNAKINSSEYKTFVIMEKKLFIFIMNPSMIFTWIFGICLIYMNDYSNLLWLNLKIILVVLMSSFHMYCARIRKNFVNKLNLKNENFYRLINEIPTILFLLIVFLVVFKPFN